jgi:multiple sugar transport system substrate-binding protein
MEVLKFAISDEVQTKSARLGKETVLNNPAVVQQFAADLEVAKGKNIAGIFKSSPSRLIRQSKYNDAVMNALNQAFQSVFRGEADINSALRKAQEEANKQIEALKQ